MNRKELIADVADTFNGNVPKYQIEAVIKAIEATILEELMNGGSVELKGFGKFSVKSRAGRKGRNPATGESISIPPTTVPSFKFGKTIKDALNS